MDHYNINQYITLFFFDFTCILTELQTKCSYFNLTMGYRVHLDVQGDYFDVNQNTSGVGGGGSQLR